MVIFSSVELLLLMLKMNLEYWKGSTHIGTYWYAQYTTAFAEMPLCPAITNVHQGKLDLNLPLHEKNRQLQLHTYLVKYEETRKSDSLGIIEMKNSGKRKINLTGS